MSEEKKETTAKKNTKAVQKKAPVKSAKSELDVKVEEYKKLYPKAKIEVVNKRIIIKN